MKTCPVCALDVEDAYLFCPDDGSSLRSLSSGLPESEPESSHMALPTEVYLRGFSRPDFRVAAIATVIALTVLALGATYALVSGMSKRPSTSARRVASAEEAPPQSLLFVPTPPEARDYQEAQPASPTPSQEPPAPRPVDRESHEAASASPTEHGVRNSKASQPVQERSVATPSQPPVAMTRVSTSPIPAVPRGNTRGFDARLIHVRSRKTPSGFRYDLTFNMQEQAGRASQWQRLLITTRSASGMSHSEAIPFVHRLGATGSLTFTISVELTGRSQGDWQGQLLCTTLGWDNTGAPLQASFGANVAP
jgi:outer membrane biosynthesis protein TonB